MALLECEKHVIKEGTEESWPRVAWCGATIWRWAWAFLDVDHARESETRGSKLQMCPECKAAIARAYKPPPTKDPED